MSMFFQSQTITFDAALRDLKRGNDRSRIAAAQALGAIDDAADRQRAAAALIEALGDAHPAVRMQAAFGLGGLGQETGLEPLIGRIGDVEASVRQAAIIALGRLGFSGAFEPLLDALKNGAPDVRFQAVTSLAELDGERAKDALVEAVADPDDQVSGAAAVALAALGDVSVRAELAKRLATAGDSAKFELSYGLAMLGGDEGRGHLEAKVSDRDRGWDAIEALEALGDARAVPALSSLGARLFAPPELKVRAAAAVIELGGNDAAIGRAKQALLAGLGARRDEVRALSVELLGKVGGAWAVAGLQALRAQRRGASLASEIDRALDDIDGRVG